MALWHQWRDGGGLAGFPWPADAAPDRTPPLLLADCRVEGEVQSDLAPLFLLLQLLLQLCTSAAEPVAVEAAGSGSGAVLSVAVADEGEDPVAEPGPGPGVAGVAVADIDAAACASLQESSNLAPDPAPDLDLDPVLREKPPCCSRGDILVVACCNSLGGRR